IRCGEIEVAVAGGLESVSLVQDHRNRHRVVDEALMASCPGIYATMIATAENVAARYRIGREAQDVYALQSQQRTAAAQATGALGLWRGFAVAGCDPDEMGIGPVLAVPRLLQRHGLKVDDIDLWELNEAFAVQVLHCRDRLGIPNERLNVNGGAISIGHPFGMT